MELGAKDAADAAWMVTAGAQRREIDMETDGDRLILVPIRKTRKARVKEAMDEVLTRHASTFRKLAK